MILPRGVTGFRDHDEPPLPVCDLATFRGHCHAASRNAGGTVRIGDASVGNTHANFVYCVIDFTSESVAVLLNAHYPMIAFANPLREGQVKISFIDSPALAAEFESIGGYKILAANLLAEQVIPAACESLNQAELKQVKYWRPQNVGELIFNLWD